MYHLFIIKNVFSYTTTILKYTGEKRDTEYTIIRNKNYGYFVCSNKLNLKNGPFLFLDFGRKVFTLLIVCELCISVVYKQCE